MKPTAAIPIGKKRLSVQAALILLASVTLGLTYNALNPTGLRLNKPPQHVPTLQAKAATSVYKVETILARPISSSDSEPTPNTLSVAARTAPPLAETRIPVSATRTTWEKAQPLVESGQVVLIDSRPRLSYEAGHIPRAVNLPENEISSRIGAFRSQYPPATTRLLIYCSTANCGSSAKLASLLIQKYGYQDVQYVPGGYLEWRKTQKSL